MSIPSLAEYIYQRQLADLTVDIQTLSPDLIQEYITEYKLKYEWRKDTVWE